MFNRLPIISYSNLIFRCQGCKNNLFRQNDIDQYLKYDSQNMDKLQKFNNYKKDQIQAQYFMILTDIFMSSLNIEYSYSYLVNCHPFLKMYMFPVLCSYCKIFLGFFVQTVNLNTVWMKNRILIDVKNLSCIIDGKENIKKVIRNLQIRLIKKIKQNNQNTGYSQKEQQIIQQLKISMMNLKKKQKQQIIMKIKSNFQSKTFKGNSIISTLPHTNILQKTQSQPKFNFFNSYLQKNNNIEIENQDRKPEGLKSKNYHLTQKKTNYLQKLIGCQYQEDKQEMQESLQNLKFQILKLSKFTNCSNQFKRIFDNLEKLNNLILSMEKKIPSQILKIKNLVNYIGMKIIRPMQHSD